MKPTDGIRISAASLLENPLRSFLTLLGIAISVTAVILVVSVINGLDLYIADSIGDLGPDVFVVNKFGILKNHEEWLKAARRNKDLKMEDADAIRRQAVLASKVGVSRGSGASVKFGSKTVTDVSVAAVSAEIFDIQSVDIAEGRGFIAAEVDHAVPVCFLGYEVADKLFARLDPIDREVKIWGQSFQVVGVAKKRGSVFGSSQDNFVRIPITLYQKMRGTRGSISISVKAARPDLLADCMDDVRAIMRARHHLRYKEDDDFGFVTSAGVMEVWDNLTRMIFRVAVFVVGISLVVGGIVIMNIMLLTVVERTREIGIRKAVGARQRDIRVQFLVESVMLCAAGGLIGVAVGYLGAWAVRSYTPLPARFPLWAPLVAIAVTSAVGIFFGIHPARQAARLDPIEALRSQTT
jgi:putative ABC transport system permease protein